MLFLDTGTCDNEGSILLSCPGIPALVLYPNFEGTQTQLPLDFRAKGHMSDLLGVLDLTTVAECIG